MDLGTFLDTSKVILKNTFYQLAFSIGVIALFGFIVGLLNNAFYKLVGDKIGRIVCLLTGFIGVPIHEIGHAFFCLIFGHKIDAMKLYQPNNAEGTLGYVMHSYNKRNIFHQFGNFFIAFGPILFGSAVLFVLMFWLVPNLFGAFRNNLGLSQILTFSNFSASAHLYFFDILRRTVITFYSFSDLRDWRWWLFIIPACSIALNMSLSVPDIKTSWTGFSFIVIALLIANTSLYFLDIDKSIALVNYCLTAGAVITNFLMISIVFSLFLLLLGVIVRVLMGLRGKT